MTFVPTPELVNELASIRLIFAPQLPGGPSHREYSASAWEEVHDFVESVPATNASSVLL
jgi:hypothetical protein